MKVEFVHIGKTSRIHGIYPLNFWELNYSTKKY